MPAKPNSINKCLFIVVKFNNYYNSDSTKSMPNKLPEIKINKKFTIKPRIKKALD